MSAIHHAGSARFSAVWKEGQTYLLAVKSQHESEFSQFESFLDKGETRLPKMRGQEGEGFNQTALS